MLQRIARNAMHENGMLAELRPRAAEQLNAISGVPPVEPDIRDLRQLLWCSIDNDDSLDLDQLSAAETLIGGSVKLRIAIADVDALVPKGSPIDLQAQHNTTSVYTAAEIFPMLPERLSTDLTSLNPGVDRLAMVIEMDIDAGGGLLGSAVYRALVHNRAKLTYDAVAAWLDGAGPMPEGIGQVPGLEAAIRMQDDVAQRLRALRRKAGALDFESIEAKPVFDGSVLLNLIAEEGNRAKELIEDFMIAANGVTARFLAARKFPSIRRVVRIPKRWDRIVDLAAEYDFKLPAAPSSKALNKFLSQAKKSDPLRFPDLSLNVIKLMGAGEYAMEMAGAGVTGHFGLAVRDYAHSTAPNRRYPDLITQRLLKAALAGQPTPYSKSRLEALAQHCTEMEEAAKKVERFVEKCAAAALLRNRVGETFDAIVTGVADAGVWVRLIEPPVEGKLVEGRRGLQAGDALQVRLLNANVERGFVDFQQVEKGRGRAPAQLSDRRTGFRRKSRRGAAGAKGKTGRKRPRKMR